MLGYVCLDYVRLCCIGLGWIKLGCWFNVHAVIVEYFRFDIFFLKSLMYKFLS